MNCQFEVNGKLCGKLSNDVKCEFHRHMIFEPKNLKNILKNGLGDDYEEIVDWIREHPQNIEEDNMLYQDYYGCGTNYSSACIVLHYLLSHDKHGMNCIYPDEKGTEMYKQYL